MGRTTYNVENFIDCLRAGYVDSEQEFDSRFAPRFISNDKERNTDLLSVIRRELSNCDAFDFVVAFVADHGLQTLIESLNELERRGIRGRFLTSTYLNFNSPDVFRKLLEFSNLEVRVYQGNLHTKGYLFSHDPAATVIVGSSNLTQAALTHNMEWNVLYRSFENGAMLKSAKHEFEQLWNDSQTAALTPEWIESYSRYIESNRPKHQTRLAPFSNTTAWRNSGSQASNIPIKPNPMQEKALAALEELHDKNAPRALLISATGTGKTFLSALDILSFAPQKVLFVAHRRRILQASMNSYKMILGEGYTYELYDPAVKSSSATCVFSMVSTLVNHLDDFRKDEFDYIVIDEAHRTGAASYRKVMDYFQPRFYFGMTATPSRTDSFDVFQLFNHTIAYQITLKDALENNMLTPFHYFGITDIEIDDEAFDDLGIFGKLTSDERIKHIVNKIERYSIGRSGRRGLVFCNRNDEAAELSKKFNEMGYRTAALSGADSDEIRNRTIDELESGKLEYIFSVDIFNEGIDIPSLNQIIMLRRTESPIVFIQQLGRGLRLSDSKEYVLVLDFIGNYQNNYFIPIALSGDRTYNKDNLRNFIKEGSAAMPGCSTISFDRISESRIFKALDGGRLHSSKLIREEYRRLKEMVGHIPSLLEFDEQNAIDPLIIIKKYNSYPEFLAKYEPDYKAKFSSTQLALLKFASQRLASGKRPEELLLLEEILRDHVKIISKERLSCKAMKSAASVLSGSFASIRCEKNTVAFLRLEDARYALTTEFVSAIENEAFREALCDVVRFGLNRSKLYSNTYRDTSFVLWKKYTYEEVCRLLNWPKSVNGQNIGGYMYDKDTNTFPVFINYEKDPSISDTIKYEDRFISEAEIIAISKQPRHLDSPEIKRLENYESSGMRAYLFVRKNKDDKDGGKEFYFLGEIKPTGKFTEFTMPGTTSNAVEITYRLLDPVRPDLYDYLTSDLERKDSDRDDYSKS